MSTEGTETPSLHDVLNSQREVIVINRRKRNAKRNMSKVRYELEKLTANTPANEGEVRNLEHCMEELWQALEETQTVLDDLAALYIDNGDKENQKIISEESQKIERECNLAIEKAQRMIVAAADNERNDKSSTETETTDNKKNNLSTGPNSSFQSTSTPIKPSTSKASPINAKLQPLAVPSFNGSKAEFEEYWALFESLVDCSEEPTNIKMARLKQSLTGSALEAVRGLGVSQPEYEEAKEILKTKFGGQRRQLQAYLDELEKIPPLKTTDLKGFERFADLVRVTVVKLQAEGRDGELGEGTLHSMLAKKLTDRQVECYTRWISENHKERSVISLRDWLKEEVAIKVEAAEMSHGLAVRAVDTSTAPKPRSDRFKSRSFFASSGSHQSKSTNAQNQKPPCAFCSGLNHGIWNCHSFKQKSVEERWSIAKEKKLCFRCLSSDHMGKDCKRSHPCNVNRCQLSHHQLLHRVVASPTVLTSPQNTSGFSSTHFTQASPVWSASNPVPCNPQSSPVQYSSPSVPVQYSSPSVPAQFSPPAPPKGADQALPREGVRTNHAVNMSTHSPEMAQCALRTVPVWLKGNGRKVKVNAILDDGSNETFLNQEVANYLGLQAPFQSVQVHVLNNAVETFQSMPLCIEIESVSGDFHKEIEVQTCPQQVTGLYKVEDWNDTKQQWPHLKNCQFPKPAREGIVDLLIGVDNAELHYSMADIQGKNGGPIARLGPLGWTCIGTTSGRASEGKRSHLVHSFLVRESERTNCVQQEHEVNNLLRRFWEVDSYGTETPRTSVMTKEEKNAYETVKSSLQHTGNRYRITVPWKDNKDVLPNNKEAALKRLEMTEKSLAKKDFVKSEYANTLKAYVEKGYLRKLAPEEKQSINSWYLPHFPIVRMDKTTTKVRIVFDCSAKHLGVSLNDVIHAGPKLQSELFDVLVRFRRNPIGIVCDIKEMYLQVEIEEKDRPFFRLLWRDLETDREPDEYEFTRVVFGKNSAPMESQLVSQENARQHQDRYPLAAETVLKSTYMDDSIDSVEDEATALKLYGELQELWGIAGMQARKWVSNSEEVLSAIPEDHRASEILINDDRPVTKTLGVAWSSKEDTLKISVPAVSPELQITKRNVLRRIASVFDPLGLISPIVIGGKVLLQTLWSRGYGWDDEIEDETAVKITKWLQQLEAVSGIKVPRCVRMADTVSSFKLIMFADASEIAYGAAVYARVEYKHSDVVTCRLIASKSRVAPLIPVTIPRLELMAAVLGLRLTLTLLGVLSKTMSDVTFYSDSMDVLWWIRGHGKDFRPFVANRVGEIQMHSDPSQWQHVPTTQNPADQISRGTQVEELADRSLWWEGPEWVLQDPTQWPKLDIGSSKDVTEKRQPSTALLARIAPVQADKTNDVNQWRLNAIHFSSWTHLVRIHARVNRFLYNLKCKSNRLTDKELLPEEIHDAEEDIIRQAQYNAFTDEYKALVSKKQLPAKSQLTKLSPRLDENGLIRLEGRLMFAEHLPYDMKYPIILPRGHQVTKLIVKYYHELANHAAGVNFILSQISQRFWIIAAREEIRSWEGECNECKKRKTKLATQVMAPLPPIRLRFTCRPFDQCAVDYAGPFETVQGRGIKRQKRYLCLFTCLQTRAIHLEMAWALDTDSFLNAFTRFTSRRGVPTEMISDNGTNFVGAVNELRELVGQLDHDKIKRKTSNIFNSVKWHFNPPAGPHFGGIHESMIKSAKTAIYAVLGKNDVRDEELITAFSGVEGLLNSRPLTYQSSDHRDALPLTPNHFLHGQTGGEVAPESVDSTDFNLNKRWRRVQQLITQVWTRWLTEYLPTLNRRPKWTEVVKDLKEGDVVLALEPNVKRGHWPLGRIVETYPGKDGHTRVAKVQVGNKTVVRPIHKLVPLFMEK